MGADAPVQLSALGNVDLLSLPSIALFCSSRCPGHAILATYDQAAHWRDAGQCVISGFHSPVEKECLRILLRGKSPVIICPARGMLRNIPADPVDCRVAFDEGRLLLVSPFPDNVRRVTAETATIRNRFVAALAATIAIAHAAPGSKIEAMSRELFAVHKPFYSFDHSVNKG
jgi:predicted Rossmann fold nucleotide-binding protein DprA/Smf involved in DNA uptake